MDYYNDILKSALISINSFFFISYKNNALNAYQLEHYTPAISNLLCLCLSEMNCAYFLIWALFYSEIGFTYF